MPYFFLWGALVLKGTQLTRISNGIIENYQCFMKKKTDKDVLPHRNLISNFDTIEWIATEYLEFIEANITRKTTKRKAISIEGNHGFGEVEIAEATESWHKCRSTFSNGEKQTSSYQNNSNVDKITTKKQII